MPDHIGPYVAYGQIVLDSNGERVVAVSGWNRRGPAERRALAERIAHALNLAEGWPEPSATVLPPEKVAGSHAAGSGV